MLTEDPSQPLLVSHNLILSLNPSLSKTLEDTTKRLEKLFGFAVCVGLGWWITDGILTQVRLFRLANSSTRKD
ncbi:hypothetical protein TrRE_jg8724 [Triparma retinervis]|uniref:Uncharacterized protein n=1 Tax=Triparma retinervis TaxID=2557542 RepID=A0A9W7A0I9_9STRA|nr:hypothetical protein TrRE_jg8724 [Triparma retinervis]